MNSDGYIVMIEDFCDDEPVFLKSEYPEIFRQIEKAQREHVGTQYFGTYRTVLKHIDADVKWNFQLVSNSLAQRWATFIANNYNLQTHIFRHENRFDLVIVCQIDGPISDENVLSMRLEHLTL